VEIDASVQGNEVGLVVGDEDSLLVDDDLVKGVIGDAKQVAVAVTGCPNSRDGWLALRGSATGTRQSRASRRCGATSRSGPIRSSWTPPSRIALRPEHGDVICLLWNMRVVLLERLGALPALDKPS
jgi:hypothetical protein